MYISVFFKKFIVAFILLMLLVACGGGGESSPPPAPAPTPTPNISLAPSPIDFAGIVLLSSSDKTLQITNTGNANLRIGQISPPDLPFSIISDTCSNATLTPSQTCSLGARFSPTSQGQLTSTLSIPSNDPDTSTVNVSLSGIGYGLNVWINSFNSNSCPSGVDVTVTDPVTSNNNQRLISELSWRNFTLTQNGQPLQIIVPITNTVPAPVSLVLALDSSSSTNLVLPQIKTAAINFVNRLTFPGDYAAICNFNSVPYIQPTSGGFSTDSSELRGWINSIASGTGTAFHLAVNQSIDRAVTGQSNTQRAVIVLSDGEDTASGSTTLDQIIANAKAKRIPVFTIFYADPGMTADNVLRYSQIMQRLANETGGQYYNSANVDFDTIFQQITNTLSNRWTINYTSTTCTGTLDVTVNWNSGTVVLTGKDSRTFP